MFLGSLSFPAKETECPKDKLTVRDQSQGTCTHNAQISPKCVPTINVERRSTSPTHSSPKKRRVYNAFVPKQGVSSFDTLIHNPTRSPEPLLDRQILLDEEETANISTKLLKSRLSEVSVHPQLSLIKFFLLNRYHKVMCLHFAVCGSCREASGVSRLDG